MAPICMSACCASEITNDEKLMPGSSGEPAAARAVGRACATNQAAGVIPCHRAVGASGALTGYRWGVARKERLLAEERRRSNT